MNELIRITGTYIEIPGRRPKIEDIIEIVSIDEIPDYEDLDEIVKDIESNPEFVKSIERGQKEIDEGKTLDHKDLLKLLTMSTG